MNLDKLMDIINSNDTPVQALAEVKDALIAECDPTEINKQQVNMFHSYLKDRRIRERRIS